MAGRPRTRIAERLSARMAIELHRNGPVSLDLLLYQLGYGRLHHPNMDRIERAGERMALARLVNVHGARIEDGRVYPRGWERAA